MSENTLGKYFMNFGELELYDDKYINHHYKDYWKPVLMYFWKLRINMMHEIYQTFFRIYQSTAENKSDKMHQINFHHNI